jgi:hypothetical protein
MPKPKRWGYLWVEADHYQRLLDLFPGKFPDNHRDFAQRTHRGLVEVRRKGIDPVRCPVDPDHMRAWIDAQVDPNARKPTAYVGWLLAEMDSAKND